MTTVTSPEPSWTGQMRCMTWWRNGTTWTDLAAWFFLSHRTRSGGCLNWVLIFKQIFSQTVSQQPLELRTFPGGPVTDRARERSADNFLFEVIRPRSTRASHDRWLGLVWSPRGRSHSAQGKGKNALFLLFGLIDSRSVFTSSDKNRTGKSSSQNSPWRAGAQGLGVVEPDVDSVADLRERKKKGMHTKS